MIRVNLLKTRQTKPITIPFGWIIVALVGLGICGVLFMLDQHYKRKTQELLDEKERVLREARSLKKHWHTLKQLKEQVRSLEADHAKYVQLLGQKDTGWTPTLLLFEELLKASETVWFRDLRIDGDGRVMINAVSKSNKKGKKFTGITKLYEEIKSRKTKFKTVRLKRIQKSKEQREDVAQFELNCVLMR